MEEREARDTVDRSIVFLISIIASVLLSLWATLIQRDQLRLTLAGCEKEAAGVPNVYPIRRFASALVIGSLGFFLCLAQAALKRARAGDDPAAVRSAEIGSLASLLVLAAAVIRLLDLDRTERARQSAADAVLPPD